MSTNLKKNLIKSNVLFCITPKCDLEIIHAHCDQCDHIFHPLKVHKKTIKGYNNKWIPETSNIETIGHYDHYQYDSYSQDSLIEYHAHCLQCDRTDFHVHCPVEKCMLEGFHVHCLEENCSWTHELDDALLTAQFKYKPFFSYGKYWTEKDKVAYARQKNYEHLITNHGYDRSTLICPMHLNTQHHHCKTEGCGIICYDFECRHEPHKNCSLKNHTHPSTKKQRR